MAFITKFSIIQIIEDGYQYHLIDSAESHEHLHTMKPTKPWSTFIPDQNHMISIVEDEEETYPERVQSPIRFKNEYNILKKAKIIQMKKANLVKKGNNKKDKKPFKNFTIEL